MNNVRAWLEELERIISVYEREVEDAIHAVDLAKSRLTGAESHLEAARHFLEMEKERLAAQSPPLQLSLKDACTRAVQEKSREKGRAKIKDIIDWLAGHGIELKTEYPSRAIHAALIHAKDVRKVEPGTYEAI